MRKQYYFYVTACGLRWKSLEEVLPPGFLKRERNTTRFPTLFRYLYPRKLTPEEISKIESFLGNFSSYKRAFWIRRVTSPQQNESSIPN